MLVIDQSQNSGSADLFVADTFRMQLTENPTTGYRWHLKSDGVPLLRLVQDSFDPAQGPAGSGGVRYWIFEAVAAGSVALGLELRRNWQPAPIGTFDIAISVKAR